jgi:hypothetical protein
MFVEINDRLRRGRNLIGPLLIALLALSLLATHSALTTAHHAVAPLSAAAPDERAAPANASSHAGQHAPAPPQSDERQDDSGSSIFTVCLAIFEAALTLALIFIAALKISRLNHKAAALRGPILAMRTFAGPGPPGNTQAALQVFLR